MMVSTMEEDQVFETHVQKGYKSYCESSDEEIELDGKGRDKNSQAMEQSDGEIDELDFEGDDRPSQLHAKIEQIDKEMEEKLRKLHEVMSSKNMNRSAGVIEQCLEACQDNQAKMKTKGKAKTSKRILTHEDFLVNENSNAMKGKILNNQSEETIYHQAVQKRNSSSSEDEGTNLSEDCLHNIEDLIISVRAKSSGKKQPLMTMTDSDSEEDVEEAGPSSGGGVKQMELPQFN